MLCDYCTKSGASPLWLRSTDRAPEAKHERPGRKDRAPKRPSHGVKVPREACKFVMSTVAESIDTGQIIQACFVKIKASQTLSKCFAEELGPSLQNYEVKYCSTGFKGLLSNLHDVICLFLA